MTRPEHINMLDWSKRFELMGYLKTNYKDPDKTGTSFTSWQVAAEAISGVMGFQVTENNIRPCLSILGIPAQALVPRQARKDSMTHMRQRQDQLEQRLLKLENEVRLLQVTGLT